MKQPTELTLGSTINYDCTRQASIDLTRCKELLSTANSLGDRGHTEAACAVVRAVAAELRTLQRELEDAISFLKKRNSR